jgi:Cu2+-exporting ATPase
MTPLAEKAVPRIHACPHCGADTPAEVEFCCSGCASAFALVDSLGLKSFYERRQFDKDQRPPRPDPAAAAADIDFSTWIRREAKDRESISLLVDRLHCGACMWLIEQTLLRQPGVLSARVSLATRRLNVVWNPNAATIEPLARMIERLGYRVAPSASVTPSASADRDGALLLRCLAVAGFAAGNIMLLSVSIWSGEVSGIAPATRDLFHWISALIALPAIAYAGRPFFASAFAALSAGRTNMDVPISIAVVLAPSVSLYETFTSGAHAYFDSAVTLLFFLLIGRYLDHRTRRAARLGVEHFAALNETLACVIEADGSRRSVAPRDLRPGTIALVTPGQRIPADGTVCEGKSDIDTSLLNGESAPLSVAPHADVFAGTLNLTGPLKIRVGKAGDETVLAEIIRLMEAAEARRGKYVRIADRVARYYAPVVHVTALASFLGWTLIGGMAWTQAMMIAISVLIITCPCALALAVPVVQVIACRRLMQSGILLKSGDALERLAKIDHVVLDKTGTLTLGRLTPNFSGEEKTLRLAAAIAANSRHPIARAIAEMRPEVAPATNVEERPGEGLIWHGANSDWRLGSAKFAGASATQSDASVTSFLASPDGRIERFAFEDRLRPDAREACAALQRIYDVEICSGDRAEVVAKIAAEAGIHRWQAEMSPIDKSERLMRLAESNRRVLMVGDGLNDAPGLSMASVSMAPSSGADLAQTRADIVFQGESFGAAPLAIQVAVLANRLMRQNLAIALFYNLAAVPLAIFGFVTPLVAALAMSSSSILVVANSMRLARLQSTPWRRP